MRTIGAGLSVVGALSSILLWLFRPAVSAAISLHPLLLIVAVIMFLAGIYLTFTKPSRIIMNILLGVAVCTVCLLILEGVSALLLPNNCLTYKNCPNIDYNYTTTEYTMSVALDNNGFRTTDDGGTVDFAFIGDSMTFGWGVEAAQSFPALVGSDSCRRILNLGIEGADPEAYAGIIRRYADRTDTFVVSYFTGNDIFLTEHTFADDFKPVNKACSLHLCTLLYRAISSSIATDKRGQPNPLIGKDLSAIPAKAAEDALAWRINPYLIAEALAEPDLTKRWEERTAAWSTVRRNSDVLDGIVRAAAGKRLVIVLIPQNIMVSATAIKALATAGFSASDASAIVCDPTLHDSIKASLAGSDATLIDLQPILCAAPDPGRFYYPLDGHFNADGHSFTAAAIEDALALSCHTTS